MKVDVDKRLLEAFKPGDTVLAKYNMRGKIIWIKPLRSKDTGDIYLGKIDGEGRLVRVAGVRVNGTGR